MYIEYWIYMEKFHKRKRFLQNLVSDSLLIYLFLHVLLVAVFPDPWVFIINQFSILPFGLS